MTGTRGGAGARRSPLHHSAPPRSAASGPPPPIHVGAAARTSRLPRRPCSCWYDVAFFDDFHDRRRRVDHADPAALNDRAATTEAIDYVTVRRDLLRRRGAFEREQPPAPLRERQTPLDEPIEGR